MILQGNNIEILKKYPDNYFDSIVTDPPYGLGEEPNANELMKDWIEHGYHEIQGKGFMGKEWDAFVPQPLFWKEVFRVLKPGGHVLAFYGTRTYDWGVMAMRFAGFEVRDCIQWLYGSGFPKSHNIGKAVDKLDGNEREVIGESKYTNHDIRGKDGFMVNDGKKRIRQILTKGNSEWEGWGSALKPANEPIVLARKPLEKGLSIAENVLKWGTGGINIDGCRLETKPRTTHKDGSYRLESTVNANIKGFKSIKQEIPSGRFPANIILTHHPECECNQSEEEEDWNCHPDCPIKVLDEQSGITKSQRSERGNIIDNNVYGKYKEQEDTLIGHSDKGGASRFFYVAKASKSERNKGLDGFEKKKSGGMIGTNNQSLLTGSGNIRDNMAKNFHPTVKPIKLMQYLVRMVTPPNGIVLDPFCGSGTTGVACKLEGFDFVGLEQDAEYCKIAEARITNYVVNEEEAKINNNDKEQIKIF